MLALRSCWGTPALSQQGGHSSPCQAGLEEFWVLLCVDQSRSLSSNSVLRRYIKERRKTCAFEDEWIEDMVNGAIKVTEEVRCLQRGIWGRNVLGWVWRTMAEGEQSLEINMPSTDAASSGNQGYRSFKPVLVKHRKPDISPWSSSPNKLREGKKKHDFFFFQISFFLLKW